MTTALLQLSTTDSILLPRNSKSQLRAMAAASIDRRPGEDGFGTHTSVSVRLHMRIHLSAVKLGGLERL